MSQHSRQAQPLQQSQLPRLASTSEKKLELLQTFGSTPKTFIAPSQTALAMRRGLSTTGSQQQIVARLRSTDLNQQPTLLSQPHFE